MPTYDVLSIGTVYLDIIFTQFPFEEGLPVHRETVGEGYEIRPGGSAMNFARMCAEQNLKVKFVGMIGDDELGLALKKKIRSTGVTPKLVTGRGQQTNVAVHYVNSQGHSVMTSGGSANQQLGSQKVVASIQHELIDLKYIYLGGGFKLSNLLPLYPTIISSAKKQGVKIILDHGRVTNIVADEHKEIIKNIITDVDVYLPSRDEFLDVWQASSISAGIKKVTKNMSGMIVVKDSVNGCVGWDGSRVIEQPAATDRLAVNSVGAGDSFNSAVLAGLIQEKPFDEILRSSNEFAESKILPEDNSSS